MSYDRAYHAEGQQVPGQRNLVEAGDRQALAGGGLRWRHVCLGHGTVLDRRDWTAGGRAGAPHAIAVCMQAMQENWDISPVPRPQL